MKTFQRTRCIMAAVLLMTYLPACYHYVTPNGMTSEEYVATKHPAQVRLTLADSSIVTVRKPWISADSVGGHWVASTNQAEASKEERTRWAVPLSTVLRIEVYQKDQTATGLILLPFALALGFALYYAGW